MKRREPEWPMSHLPQVVVHQRKQPVEGSLVATTPGDQ
jgi:hypothetical protein